MKRFVAIQECSAGNSQVGDMWLRTKTFSPDTPISEVWKWGHRSQGTGRLMIRPDENEEGTAVKT